MKKMNAVAGIVLAAAVLSTGAYAATTSGTGTPTPPPQQEFFDQTGTMRANLAADRAELRVLLNSNSQDTKRIRSLSENISKNQDSLRQQALKYNMPFRGHGGRMTGIACGYGGNGMYGGGRMGNHPRHNMSGYDGGYHHM